MFVTSTFFENIFWSGLILVSSNDTITIKLVIKFFKSQENNGSKIKKDEPPQITICKYSLFKDRFKKNNDYSLKFLSVRKIQNKLFKCMSIKEFLRILLCGGEI